MKNIKIYHVLAILIFLDIVITIFSVKYLGAIELNPLCFDFSVFMIIKIILSAVCIYVIYKYQEDKYVGYAVFMSVVLYTIILINNLWHTVNYLYY